MRIPSHHHRDEPREDLAMTPLIDVVFLLLIFFVCASVGQLREALLPTRLAAGAVASEEPIEQPNSLGEVWLYLKQNHANQTVFEVNNQKIAEFADLRELLVELAIAARELPVILDIAPDVPVGDFIRVFDACREANFDSVHFAVERNAAGAGKRKNRNE
jgi:biopolymer transport protein ExbD